MFRICLHQTPHLVNCLELIINHLPLHSGLHSTPAGQYPENGPKPSKLGVLYYLLSICFCVFGVIMLCRFPFMQANHRGEVFMVGLPLIAFGFLCLCITNRIVDKENQAFVDYLNLKVEQYMAQHKRNIQAIPPDDPLQDV